MLIFWDQRLVFLATPKAGSTAVEMALDPLAAVSMPRPDPLKHMAARDYAAHLAPYLHSASGEHFTTVALMRHPLDWLRSWYRFMQRDELDTTQIDSPNQSFEQFIETYLSDQAHRFAGIGKQTDYLTDENGGLLIDRLFRYEDMDSLVRFLEDRLDCAITLPRVNVPPSVETKLRPETEIRLREFLADDFRLYGTIGPEHPPQNS